jgi:hypothetical protein
VALDRSFFSSGGFPAALDRGIWNAKYAKKREILVFVLFRVILCVSRSKNYFTNGYTQAV